MVCFTSDHTAAFASLPPERVGTVFDAWVDRTRDLNAMPEVEQVFVFENRGEEIGVTLPTRTGRSTPTRSSRRGCAASSSRPAGTGSVRGAACHCVLLAAERRAGTGSSPRTSLDGVVPHAARWP